MFWISAVSILEVYPILLCAWSEPGLRGPGGCAWILLQSGFSWEIHYLGYSDLIAMAYCVVSEEYWAPFVLYKEEEREEDDEERDDDEDDNYKATVHRFAMLHF